MSNIATKSTFGRSILVVEDSFILSEVLTDILTVRGYAVVGPFYRLGDAFDVCFNRRQPVDMAILDISVAGVLVFSLAELLIDLKIPFVFATGHSLAAIPEVWRTIPLVAKPYTEADIIHHVSSTLNGRPPGQTPKFMANGTGCEELLRSEYEQPRRMAESEMEAAVLKTWVDISGDGMGS